MTIEAAESDTILSIKQKIFNEKQIEINHQKLMFKTPELNDNQTVSACALYNEASANYLVFRLFNLNVESEPGAKI